MQSSVLQQVQRGAQQGRPGAQQDQTVAQQGRPGAQQGRPGAQQDRPGAQQVQPRAQQQVQLRAQQAQPKFQQTNSKGTDEDAKFRSTYEAESPLGKKLTNETYFFVHKTLDILREAFRDKFEEQKKEPQQPQPQPINQTGGLPLRLYKDVRRYMVNLGQQIIESKEKKGKINKVAINAALETMGETQQPQYIKNAISIFNEKFRNIPDYHPLAPVQVPANPEELLVQHRSKDPNDKDRLFANMVEAYEWLQKYWYQFSGAVAYKKAHTAFTRTMRDLETLAKMADTIFLLENTDAAATAKINALKQELSRTDNARAAAAVPPDFKMLTSIQDLIDGLIQDPQARPWQANAAAAQSNPKSQQAQSRQSNAAATAAAIANAKATSEAKIAHYQFLKRAVTDVLTDFATQLRGFHAMFINRITDMRVLLEARYYISDAAEIPRDKKNRVLKHMTDIEKSLEAVFQAQFTMNNTAMRESTDNMKAAISQLAAAISQLAAEMKPQSQQKGGGFFRDIGNRFAKTVVQCVEFGWYVGKRCADLVIQFLILEIPARLAVFADAAYGTQMGVAANLGILWSRWMTRGDMLKIRDQKREPGVQLKDKFGNLVTDQIVATRATAMFYSTTKLIANYVKLLFADYNEIPDNDRNTKRQWRSTAKNMLIVLPLKTLLVPFAWLRLDKFIKRFENWGAVNIYIKDNFKKEHAKEVNTIQKELRDQGIGDLTDTQVQTLIENAETYAQFIFTIMMNSPSETNRKSLEDLIKQCFIIPASYSAEDARTYFASTWGKGVPSIQMAYDEVKDQGTDADTVDRTDKYMNLLAWISSQTLSPKENLGAYILQRVMTYNDIVTGSMVDAWQRFLLLDILLAAGLVEKGEWQGVLDGAAEKAAVEETKHVKQTNGMRIQKGLLPSTTANVQTPQEAKKRVARFKLAEAEKVMEQAIKAVDLAKAELKSVENATGNMQQIGGVIPAPRYPPSHNARTGTQSNDLSYKASEDLLRDLFSYATNIVLNAYQGVNQALQNMSPTVSDKTKQIMESYQQQLLTNIELLKHDSQKNSKKNSISILLDNHIKMQNLHENVKELPPKKQIQVAYMTIKNTIININAILQQYNHESDQKKQALHSIRDILINCKALLDEMGILIPKRLGEYPIFLQLRGLVKYLREKFNMMEQKDLTDQDRARYRWYRDHINVMVKDAGELCNEREQFIKLFGMPESLYQIPEDPPSQSNPKHTGASEPSGTPRPQPQPHVPLSGGHTNPRRRGAPPPARRWRRTPHRTPDGRALWQNPATGELRVRKMVKAPPGAPTQRRARYVKP
jgi:hypothetical protein